MKKVLIIDDTKNIRILLSKCLELEGYAISMASDGREGLELIKKQSFDLILLDIKLPEISGTEVLRRMQKMGIKTPVIIITAYPTIKNAVDCTRLGAVAYLQKPFTADRLRNLLKELDLQNREKQGQQGLKDNVENLLKEGEADKAINLLKAALGEKCDDADIYYLLGKSYEIKDDKASAEKFYSIAQIWQ